MTSRPQHPHYEDRRGRPYRRGISKGAVIGIVEAAILIAIAISVLLYNQRQERIRTINQYQRILLERELQKFSLAISGSAIIHGSVIMSPTQTLSQTLDLLNHGPLDANMPLLASGKDYWGNAFKFVVSADCRTVILYSIGPNGKDEKGGGDDIGIRLCDSDGTGNWIDCPNGHTNP